MYANVPATWLPSETALAFNTLVPSAVPYTTLVVEGVQFTVGVTRGLVNVAVTVNALLTEIVHAFALTLSHPVHPVNVELVSAVAVSTTLVTAV